MCDYRAARQRLRLLTLGLFFGLAACTPFEVRQVLDGPKGKPLSITPSSTKVAGGGSVTFTADGGVPPYTFSVASGAGSVDAATGVYTASVGAATTTVRAADKAGKSVDAVVTVEDYSISAVPVPTGSTTGQGVSGTFTIQNNSSTAGVSSISWQVYASFGDAVYNAGDVLLASGSLGPLACLGSASPGYAGTWPSRAGLYYIVVRASTGDAPGIADAASAVVAVSRPLSPDYTASFDVGIPWSGVVGTPVNATGTCQITIDNPSGNDGHSAIAWSVYLSTDKVLDGGDAPVDQGITGPIVAGGSTIVAFTGNWPAAPGNLYYFIVSVRASDDSNPMDDAVVAEHPSIAGDYRYQEGLEDNSATGPNPTAGQTSSTAATLGVNQTLAIEGSMDATGQSDTYRFATNASLFGLSILATWTTGFDDVDFFLWNTGPLNVDSLSGALDVEPPTGTFDWSGITAGTYFISANMCGPGGSVGKKYVMLVRGLP